MKIVQNCFVAAMLVALFATGCAVDSTSVDIALTRAALAPNNDPNAPTPTPLPDMRVNDQGEVLLDRFISGEFKSSDCDFGDDGRVRVAGPRRDEEVEPLPLEVLPECGWLTRPLHGSTKQDVELPVMIFKATGQNPAADPVIYLHGGPSDGVLSYIEYIYEDAIGPFLEERDVIVFDQRGTGLAKPELECDSPFHWFAANEDPETYVPRIARTCAFDLQSNGIQLDQFSRQLSADDVMVLARELGYESFNLHGSSWGGILAYTVAQLHPEWVRSAVLDSPLAVDTDISGSMPGSFQEAMNALQANCDLDLACAERHGDIVTRYIEVFTDLEENPRTLLFLELFELELTADELSYLMFGLFYRPDAIARIPDMLLELENGGTSIVQELANDYGLGWGFDFTFLTYMCTDIIPTSSTEQVEAQQIGIPAFDRVDDAPDGRGHTAQEICRRMKVEKPAAPTLVEVVPTTPLIVFSGSMDPITSRSSGERIVADVPNGTFVGFSDLSHGVTHTPCGLEIALAFISDPEALLDVSCSEDRTFEFD